MSGGLRSSSILSPTTLLTSTHGLSRAGRHGTIQSAIGMPGAIRARMVRGPTIGSASLPARRGRIAAFARSPFATREARSVMQRASSGVEVHIDHVGSGTGIAFLARCSSNLRLGSGIALRQHLLVCNGTVDCLNGSLQLGESRGEMLDRGTGGDHLLGHSASLAHETLAGLPQGFNVIRRHCFPPRRKGRPCRRPHLRLLHPDSSLSTATPRRILRHRPDGPEDPVRDRRRDARAQRQDCRALGCSQSFLSHAATRGDSRDAPRGAARQGMHMTFGIIGAGNVGLAIAKTLARAGIAASIANSRDPESLKDAVGPLGPAIKAMTREEAARADMVFVAVNWSKLSAAVSGLPAWEGRIVVDANNPVEAPLFKPVELQGCLSSQIAIALVSGARLVKAFNHLRAEILASDPRAGGARRVLFYASEDDPAKVEVGALVDRIGF